MSDKLDKDIANAIFNQFEKEEIERFIIENRTNNARFILFQDNDKKFKVIQDDRQQVDLVDYLKNNLKAQDYNALTIGILKKCNNGYDAYDRIYSAFEDLNIEYADAGNISSLNSLTRDSTFIDKERDDLIARMFKLGNLEHLSGNEKEQKAITALFENSTPYKPWPAETSKKPNQEFTHEDLRLALNKTFLELKKGEFISELGWSSLSKHMGTETVRNFLNDNRNYFNIRSFSRDEIDGKFSFYADFSRSGNLKEYSLEKREDGSIIIVNTNLAQNDKDMTLGALINTLPAGDEFNRINSVKEQTMAILKANDLVGNSKQATDILKTLEADDKLRLLDIINNDTITQVKNLQDRFLENGMGISITVSSNFYSSKEKIDYEMNENQAELNRLLEQANNANAIAEELRQVNLNTLSNILAKESEYQYLKNISQASRPNETKISIYSDVKADEAISLGNPYAHDNVPNSRSVDISNLKVENLQEFVAQRQEQEALRDAARVAMQPEATPQRTITTERHVEETQVTIPAPSPK